MKFYFVASGALSTEQLTRMRSADVPFAPTSAAGGWIGVRSGIGFSETGFSQLLDVLGGRVTKETVLDGQEKQQLVEPKLVFDRTPKPVVISEVETSKDIKPLLTVIREILLPRAGSDIILRSAGGTSVDSYSVKFSPYTGNRRRLPPPGYIYLWGTSNSLSNRCAMQSCRLWSIDLPPTAPMIPGPSKSPIVDFYNTVVGEVTNNVALCLFNLLAENLPVSLAQVVFRYFVEDLTEIWFGTKDSKAAHLRLRKKQREEFFREETVKAGLQALDRSLRQQHERLDQVREEIALLNRQLMLLMAHREGAIRAIEGISTDLDKKKQTLSDQYDLMRSHKRVDDVIVHSRFIEIRTSTVYCQHRITRGWHEIGRMVIRIYTDPPKKSDSGSTPTITVENLTHRRNTIRDGFHHPHVWPEGNLCMGGYQKQMNELLISHDYASLLGLIIFFLETHTPTDAAGKYLDMWPELTGSQVEALVAKGILPEERKGENHA